MLETYVSEVPKQGTVTLISTILALLVPAGAAVAQPVWNVTVGNNGSLTFDPDNLTGVQTGDMIQFFLYVCLHHIC